MIKSTKNILAITAFILIAGFLLIAYYQDVLYTAQDRSVFFTGSSFFHETMGMPFGFMQWIGGYLTQYFYYPLVGTILLLLIWGVTFLVGIKTFKLKPSYSSLFILPLSCLTTSIIDLGYWIYCTKFSGYWFSQSLSYLILLLLLWGFQNCSQRLKLTWQLIIPLLLYPILGWYTYLFAITAVALQIKQNAFKWNVMMGNILGCIASVASPLIWSNIAYTTTGMDKIWSAGFPIFQNGRDFSILPSIPFILLAITTFILAILPYNWLEKKLQAKTEKKTNYKHYGFTIVVCAISAFYMWNAMFKDYNHIIEMRMNKALMEENWQSIIKEAENASYPSRTMVMLKDIALMNTGQLGERAFELSCDGRDITNPDSLNISIMHIASPGIYYNYGKVNYAIRWAMESGVAYGFTPYVLKNMILAAQATGEKKLYDKYMHLLHKTTFYSDWQPKPTTKVIKDLQNTFANVLDSDNNNCERYMIEFFSRAYGSRNLTIMELNVFYSMLYRNPDAFWPAFLAYAAFYPGNTLPQHYQEAYCLFMEIAPQELPFKINLSKSTIDRYRRFRAEMVNYSQQGASNEKQKELMRKDWGGTYWWHHIYGRKSY